MEACGFDTTENRELLRQMEQPLLDWFASHARKLPWRVECDPYYIWVSEIMLQQTRVEAVKRYFRRFITELPTIRTLAECPEDKLLKLWEGLGYYNRVRNMQKTAQILVKDYGGKFPADHTTILGLPGIGSYTAGAIASIAFGILEPAVDGNVLRVISRVLGSREDISKQPVRRRMEDLIRGVLPGSSQCGLYNQAWMEIGACVCVPNGPPLCENCPLAVFCRAYQEGTTGEIPVKPQPKARRIEEHTILIIRDGKRVALFKRPQSGLLAGLYEFYNADGTLDRKAVLDHAEALGCTPLYIEELQPSKHIFSHIEWHMTAYLIQVADVDADDRQSEESPVLWVSIEEAGRTYAIPSAYEAYVKYLAINRLTKDPAVPIIETN